jgi:hypothetical protein
MSRIRRSLLIATASAGLMLAADLLDGPRPLRE